MFQGLLSARGERPNAYPINYWRLTAIIFFIVSGGPLGIEALVAAAGPLVALVCVLGVSWLWTVPETAVTTELSLVFPTNAGFCIWVATAFTNFWGFLVWYLSFTSGVLTAMVYPCFIINIFAAAVEPSLINEGYYGWGKYIATPCILAIVVLNTWRGLRFGGDVLFWLGVAVVVPYVVFIIIGLLSVDADHWIETPSSGWADADWGSVVTVLCWSLNYWQSASALSGEIEDINTAFPSAMVTSLWLSVLLVGLTVLAATGATDYSQSDYRNQLFLGQIAEDIAGSWLKYCLYAAGVVSSLGQLNAQYYTTAYQTAGMADKGLLPAFLSQRNLHGTPVWTMGMVTAFTLVGALLINTYADIAQLIGVVNVVYAVAEVLLFAGFIKLRYSHSDFYRPYTVPLDLPGCVCLVLPPLAFCVAIFVYASLETWLIALPLIAFGALLYPIKSYIRQRQWLTYEDRDSFFYPWMGGEDGTNGGASTSAGGKGDGTSSTAVTVPREEGGEEEEDRAAATPLMSKP